MTPLDTIPAFFSFQSVHSDPHSTLKSALHFLFLDDPLTVRYFCIVCVGLCPPTATSLTLTPSPPPTQSEYQLERNSVQVERPVLEAVPKDAAAYSRRPLGGEWNVFVSV